MFEILTVLHQNKTLAQLAARGIITPTFMHEFEVCLFVDASLKAGHQKNKTQAVKAASLEFNRPQSYVWSALKKIM